MPHEHCSRTLPAGILSNASAGSERFLSFLDEVRQFMDIKQFSEEVISLRE